MSKLMRQLAEEGRVARERMKLEKDRLVKREPPPPPAPICPRTSMNCIRTPTCGGICLDSWPNAQQQAQPEQDPNEAHGLWPFAVGDE